MKNIKYVYLAMAILGGIGSWVFVMQGTIANGGGFNVIDFVNSTWTNNYGKAITIDFWTAASVGTIWMMIEAHKLNMKNKWLYLIATFGVAFAFAFPLFLFFRTRYVKK